MRRPYDPRLKAQPWKIFCVFEPLESVINRLEIDGTVDTVGRHVVFHETSRGEWYDLPAALRGVIDFHRIATERHGLQADVSALERFANKLDAGSPIFESDIVAVRAGIASCKRQAMHLRVSQAVEIVDLVRVRAEVDRLKLRVA